MATGTVLTPFQARVMDQLEQQLATELMRARRQLEGNHTDSAMHTRHTHAMDALLTQQAAEMDALLEKHTAEMAALAHAQEQELGDKGPNTTYAAFGERWRTLVRAAALRAGMGKEMVASLLETRLLRDVDSWRTKPYAANRSTEIKAMFKAGAPLVLIARQLKVKPKTLLEVINAQEL